MKAFAKKLCKSCGEAPRIHPDHWGCEAWFKRSAWGQPYAAQFWLSFFRKFLGRHWASTMGPATPRHRWAMNTMRPRSRFTFDMACEICGAESSTVRPPWRMRLWRACERCVDVYKAAGKAQKSLGFSIDDDVPPTLLAARVEHLKLGRLLNRRNAA